MFNAFGLLIAILTMLQLGSIAVYIANVWGNAPNDLELWHDASLILYEQAVH